MRPFLLVIAAALSVALYRMISRGGKTHSYTKTHVISILPDGTEHVTNNEENGSISITNKCAIIDGVEYAYKPMVNEPIQATLIYEDHQLSAVRIFLNESEKLFIIDRAITAVNQVKHPTQAV
jgi:hypothetical protein